MTMLPSTSYKEEAGNYGCLFVAKYSFVFNETVFKFKEKALIFKKKTLYSQDLRNLFYGGGSGGRVGGEGWVKMSATMVN